MGQHRQLQQQPAHMADQQADQAMEEGCDAGVSLTQLPLAARLPRVKRPKPAPHAVQPAPTTAGPAAPMPAWQPEAPAGWPAAAAARSRSVAAPGIAAGAHSLGAAQQLAQRTDGVAWSRRDGVLGAPRQQPAPAQQAAPLGMDGTAVAAPAVAAAAAVSNHPATAAPTSAASGAPAGPHTLGSAQQFAQRAENVAWSRHGGVLGMPHQQPALGQRSAPVATDQPAARAAAAAAAASAPAAPMSITPADSTGADGGLPFSQMPLRQLQLRRMQQDGAANMQRQAPSRSPAAQQVPLTGHLVPAQGADQQLPPSPHQQSRAASAGQGGAAPPQLPKDSFAAPQHGAAAMEHDHSSPAAPAHSQQPHAAAAAAEEELPLAERVRRRRQALAGTPLQQPAIAESAAQAPAHEPAAAQAAAMDCGTEQVCQDAASCDFTPISPCARDAAAAMSWKAALGGERTAGGQQAAAPGQWHVQRRRSGSDALLASSTHSTPHGNADVPLSQVWTGHLQPWVLRAKFYSTIGVRKCRRLARLHVTFWRWQYPPCVIMACYHGKFLHDPCRCR